MYLGRMDVYRRGCNSLYDLQRSPWQYSPQSNLESVAAIKNSPDQTDARITMGGLLIMRQSRQNVGQNQCWSSFHGDAEKSGIIGVFKKAVKSAGVASSGLLKLFFKAEVKSTQMSFCFPEKFVICW